MHYPDADLVVLVTGESGTLCETAATLATARPCELDQYDRPVVGTINFCLGRTEKPHLPSVNGIDISAAYAAKTNATFRAGHLPISLLETAV
jgi:hypothetical protein